MALYNAIVVGNELVNSVTISTPEVPFYGCAGIHEPNVFKILGWCVHVSILCYFRLLKAHEAWNCLDWNCNIRHDCMVVLQGVQVDASEWRYTFITTHILHFEGRTYVFYLVRLFLRFYLPDSSAL